MPRETTIKSIVKGANILKLLAHGSNGVLEISRVLTLSKGTTHRILRTLVDINFVVQDPLSEKYLLGPGILELLSKINNTHEFLGICSLGEMERLRALTKETVLLHIRIGLHRVCIEEVESTENLKYVNGRGFVAPLYTGAAGKVLLSELSDSEAEYLLDKMNLIPLTKRTQVNKKRIFSEIKKTRDLGYSTSFGERVSGSACISLPVKNYFEPVALSVLGPDNRFTLAKMQQFLSEIKKSVSRISDRLLKN
ncbi:MAG: IclR family transcriptional regulator [Desulfobacterales bacterium]|jgi:DNA-binding IclR family transcriptional regulator